MCLVHISVFYASRFHISITDQDQKNAGNIIMNKKFNGLCIGKVLPGLWVTP
jgi:hypothetical protein